MKSLFNVLIIVGLLSFVMGCNLLNQDDASGEANTDSKTNANENADMDESDISFDTEDGDEVANSDEEPNPRATPGNKSYTVKFSKGKNSRGYENSVSAGSAHTYVLGAAKGQMMNVKISSTENNAVFEVLSPVGVKLSDGDQGNLVFAKTLAANGNYKVKVSGTRGTAKYSISFSITGGEKKEPPVEGSGGITTNVKFSKGKSSATYKNAVIRGERNTYVLGAKAGQKMSVSITSLENNAVFQVRGPNGYLPGAEPGTDKRSWSGQLPADGKYRIIVGGTRGNATYTVKFAIR
jgi:hypothetical protein